MLFQSDQMGYQPKLVLGQTSHFLEYQQEKTGPASFVERARSMNSFMKWLYSEVVPGCGLSAQL
jgi:hypothetical protein